MLLVEFSADDGKNDGDADEDGDEGRAGCAGVKRLRRKTSPLLAPTAFTASSSSSSYSSSALSDAAAAAMYGSNA